MQTQDVVIIGRTGSPPALSTVITGVLADKSGRHFNCMYKRDVGFQINVTYEIYWVLVYYYLVSRGFPISALHLE